MKPTAMGGSLWNVQWMQVGFFNKNTKDPGLTLRELSVLFQENELKYYKISVKNFVYVNWGYFLKTLLLR